MPTTMRKTKKAISLTAATDPTGVYTLEDLAGLDDEQLVLERDCLTYSDTENRVLRYHPNTWRRGQREGRFPPRELLYGRPAVRAKFIRAIVAGRDWRELG